MRFASSPSPIGSSIDPEASSTNTISSGVVAVSERFEVDDNAVSAVRKSAPFSLDTVMPFLLISLSDTVLSVQIRPTLDVSFSTSPCQSQMVEGSVTAVLLPLYVVADESSANAAPPNSGDNASTSTAANAALKRFVDFMSSPPSTASRPSLSPRACICALGLFRHPDVFMGPLLPARFSHAMAFANIDTPRQSSNARTTRNRASRQRRRRRLAVAPPGHIIAKGGHMELRRICERATRLFRFRRWAKGRQGVV